MADRNVEGVRLVEDRRRRSRLDGIEIEAQVRNLADFLADAKQAGTWVYGAAAGARTPYTAPDWSGGVVVVLGAEGKGLRPRVAAACDDLVSLPLQGRVSSLNVSATAAVLLYRILQFRLDTST